MSEISIISSMAIVAAMLAFSVGYWVMDAIITFRRLKQLEEELRRANEMLPVKWRVM